MANDNHLMSLGGMRRFMSWIDRALVLVQNDYHTIIDNLRSTIDAKASVWDGKQDAISDLSTIRSNAAAGKSASDTISGYGNVVTHNASEFATAAQGALAETALQAVPSTYRTAAQQDAIDAEKEDSGNKVTSISSSSTDTEYPSAKAVYDAIISTINTPV